MPPADVSAFTVTAGSGGRLRLNWTNPANDFLGVLILRRTGFAVADSPVAGQTYTLGQTVGGSSVVYTGNGFHFTDGPLANGNAYHYRVFSFDASRNYASGVPGSGVPLTGTGPSSTFNVDSVTDAHDASPGDGLCAAANGSCSLRAAIEEADALGDVTLVNVPPGVYNLMLNALKTGNPLNDITIAGTGPSLTTIINGDPQPLFSGRCGGVFCLSGGSIRIDNLTIQNGATSGSPLFPGGGGISISPGTVVTITSSLLADNFGGSAGGIHVGGTLNLSRSTVRNNKILGFGGGGVALFASGQPRSTIIDSTISGNDNAFTRGPSLGGGVAVMAGSLMIANTTISGNLAGFGIGGGLG